MCSKLSNWAIAFFLQIEWEIKIQRKKLIKRNTVFCEIN